MTKPFKRIGIFGRTGTPGVNETLKALIQFLQTHNHPVCVEAETAAMLGPLSLPIIPKEQLNQHCDLLIVVGGDGSLLHATPIVVDQQLPVLGVNRGSLGFLTDILPTKLDKIADILKGNYFVEERFLLTATVTETNKRLGQYDALNEVVIVPNGVPHMLEFEIYINKQFVCSQHADGLIIATPTGSTAYALSGGGPILHPQLDAIVLVPMFPHTLSHRPIVVDGKSEVEVIISHQKKNTARLSCDGQESHILTADMHLIIQKKSIPLKLIHPLDYQYFETLRSKLYWGKKLTGME
ncbi:MAG: NAD(+) kinase [Gammaproteobacteria bacterium]|nr:NAD(+) kinase [Gammaproteobacteria bacterium]